MTRKKVDKRDGVYKRPGRQGYAIQYRDAAGRRRVKQVHTNTEEEARELRRLYQTEAERARILGIVPPGDDLFRDLTKRYLKYQKTRLSDKSYQRTEGVIRLHLLPFFKGKVADIRRVDIQRYITARSEEVTSDSVIKEFNILKHMLGMAVEWNIIPSNPAQGVKAPEAAPDRVRFAYPDQLKLILDCSPDWLKVIVLLAVATGMRRGEIVGLRWIDIHLSLKSIIIPKTKNRKGHVVHLNQLALFTLQRLTPAGPLDRVFPGVNGNMVTMAFRRACNDAKIPDFRFHDLRHTFASWVKMSGEDTNTIRLLLGHADIRMTQRYTHLNDEYLARATGRIDNIFGDLLKGASLPLLAEGKEKKE